MIIISYIVLVWWFINSIVYIWPREPVKAAPVRITPEPLQNVQPEPTPEPVKVPEPLQQEPPKIKPYTPEPNPEREKLEKVAGNCLAASGCKFDVWHYCRNKSDIELMDIIAQYNLNN